MAKAKKTDSAGSASRKKAPAKKAAAKPAAGGAPLIDTDLAAQTAAKIIGNRAKLGLATGAPAAEAGGHESQGFKEMKESATRSGAKLVADLLPHPEGVRKPTLPFGGRDQVSHAQTQAGFNRTGVPRRTNG